MSINNLKKYKEAKLLVPHLATIVKILTLTERALSPFKMYLPVERVLKTLREQKIIVEEHYKNYSITLKNKGKS